ncbi:hypothetical protein ACWDNI_14440 [Nocardia niigatensis]
MITNPAGRIWISYFDEAGFWAPDANGTRSLQLPVGPARWDTWDAAPWPAARHTSGVFSPDCYALNVGRARVRACPYPDFPLVELESRGFRSTTATSVEYCHGVAVSGDDFAFFHPHAGRNDPTGWEIVRARREGGAIVEIGREELLLPDGRRPGGWPIGKVGRDSGLWLWKLGSPREWYRYDLGGSW